jgi:hypothetical protein
VVARALLYAIVGIVFLVLAVLGIDAGDTRAVFGWTAVGVAVIGGTCLWMLEMRDRRHARGAGRRPRSGGETPRSP